MDENPAPLGEHATEHDVARRPNVEDPTTIDANMQTTLDNININMGKMAFILEKMFNEPAEMAGKPSQGKQSVITHNDRSLTGEQSVITQTERRTDESSVITHTRSPIGRKRQTSFSESDLSEQDERVHRPLVKRGRSNQTDMNDNISIHASDSWDEEDDIRQLTHCHDKEQNTPQPSLLDDLAQSLDDDEVPGETINPKLADIAQKRWGKKLKPEKLKNILDKYKRPENCTTMINSKVNPEIWAKLSKGTRGKDLHLQYIQNTLLKATLATLQTANALIQAESKGDFSQIITQSVDSIALLGHVTAQLSQFRKYQIKPALKSEYSAICEADEQTNSKFLFGDDLAKNMKEAKEASQIGNAVKDKGAPRLIPKSKQPSRVSGYDYTNYKYTQQPFLGKRPFRNQPKKKNQWQGPQRK